MAPAKQLLYMAARAIAVLGATLLATDAVFAPNSARRSRTEHAGCRTAADIHFGSPECVRTTSHVYLPAWKGRQRRQGAADGV